MRSITGPSGGCLPCLAAQERLRQSCRRITYHTETNVQRAQEVLGRCLTPPNAKEKGLCCTRCSHHETRGKTPHDYTTFAVFVNTTGQLDWKRTTSCINTDTFHTTKPIQASCFFSFNLIRFFFPILHPSQWNLFNTRKCLKEGNAILVWQVYSPRRASHLLSDQSLKTRFSFEQLPFAPVLKLKFKWKAPMKESVLEENKYPSDNAVWTLFQYCIASKT